MLERLVDGFLGDFMEHHALYLGLRDLRRFQQMPRNRLTLAVRVSREIDHIGLSRSLAKLRHNLLLVRHHHVFGMKPFIVYLYSIDPCRSPLLLIGEIAHMSHGRKRLITAAKKTPDCAGFCGRFDYYQVLCHAGISSSHTALAAYSLDTSRILT